MNQIEIGRFLSARRKSFGMKQRQLADLLEVSDKTISKWECGCGMPEVGLILPLCKVLQITANELLSAGLLPEDQYKSKAEENIMELLEELELNKKRELLRKQYGLELKTLTRSELGAGFMTYYVTCQNGEQYVLKYASENSMNHPELEVELCQYLRKHDIPACEFVPNLQREMLSIDESGRRYSLQKYFKGTCYGYHEAPKWLLEASARMLGRVHSILKNYEKLPDGIGKGFFDNMTPETALASYARSLEIAKKNKEQEIVENLKFRMELMKRFPRTPIDVEKLTCLNTHGDFMITQLICGENQINAVVDWTTACVHPAVWELIRSYVYASPECKEGNIDIDEFKQYVSWYSDYITLNEYDIKMMPYIFYYQIAVCDYYGQYYASMTENRHIYLQQAQFSTKLMKWFDTNSF